MKYDNPFPGMNPYLERRHIWPDFHNDLIAQLRTALGPELPARYRIALQQRVEVETPSGTPLDLAFMIPDALVTDEIPNQVSPPAALGAVAVATSTVEEYAVRVRMPREVKVTWLRVETVPDQRIVTIVEILSPINKAPGRERNRYERKREVILGSGANLVEIDLLRRWEPMPLETSPPVSDYRILVCEGWQRPSALLYPWSVRQAIPPFLLPLLPEDKPLQVDLGPIIDRMHHTARYGQVARYHEPPPEPAFEGEVGAWVKERVAGFVAVALPVVCRDDSLSEIAGAFRSGCLPAGADPFATRVSPCVSLSAPPRIGWPRTGRPNRLLSLRIAGRSWRCGCAALRASSDCA